MLFVIMWHTKQYHTLQWQIWTFSGAADLRAEIFSKLVRDSELDEVVTELKQSLRDSLLTWKTTIANFRKMKQEIKDSYDKSRKAHIGGNVVSIAGSQYWFFLSFVTLGASLWISIPDNALAAAGEIIIVGIDIGYYVVSKTTLKNAWNACNVDQDLMKIVENNRKKFSFHIESLTKKHSTWWCYITF